ncbi:MAG: hypothetical protein SCH71_03720 [Desulfobulbaceae bacterium]|nr:hypothetical protein [Desulfobulbaceae bacterium]
MQMFKVILGCAFLVSSLTPTATVLAHTTTLPKNNPDNYYQRTEPDGASSVVNEFAIAHGCKGKPVIASSMLFPNGHDMVIEDQDGNIIEPEVLFDELEPLNNLVMGIKPAQVATWKEITVLRGETREYSNHGLHTEDVRAVQYTGGYLHDYMVGLLPWRASFAAIKEDSCVKEIQVRIPIVNYCERNPNSSSRLDAWIGRLTPLFNDPDVVSVGFWPTLTIINTDFDEGGCTEATVYKVSPTDADIDAYLLIQSFKP